MTKSKTIKGMFFDLDGTLCDTDEANFEAYARAFRDEGVRVDPEAFAELQARQGLRADAFIPILAPGITAEGVARVRRAKAGYYGDQMHLVKPNQRLIDFIALMREGHVMALVTTAERGNAIRVLRASGLDEMFDYMIFGDDVTQAKPHPEAYLKALELSGLAPQDVIAFEDSESGIKAATSAGLRVIKVSIRA